MLAISTYLRIRARTKQYIPFAPPLPSPKHTGKLSPRQGVHLWFWRWGLPLWRRTIGRTYASRRPVMLLGCHHSGTTILARLIGQHPDILNWSEAPEVWTPDDAFLSWGVLPEPVFSQPFLFDLDAYQRTPEAHGEYIPLIRDTFTFFAASRFKRRFMNKNPHMCISVPYIEAAFPDAFYVHIRRNGYAVVQSLLSTWRPVLENPHAGWDKLRDIIDPIYYEDSLAIVRLCARYWREMDSRAAQDLAKLDLERVYTTSYETICDDPEGILREVFAKAGLNPARYNWNQLHNPTRYPWTDMLPMENRNYKYRERMSAEEIQAVTDEIGDTLTEFGYLE